MPRKQQSKSAINPKEDLDALEANLVKAQNNLTRDVQEIGYQLDIVRAIRPYWQNATELISQEVPLSSGGAVIHDWRQRSAGYLEEQEKSTRQLAGISGTASYAATTTFTLVYMYPTSPPFDATTIDRVMVRRTQQEIIEQQLRKIDDPLANTYATVWQYIHYPALDPVRGPLFLMRQVFDHFLEALAPDNKVQSQPGFQPDLALKAKNGVGITRALRIRYVFDTMIPDAQVRQTLLIDTKSFVDIYDSLNSAHKRKNLDQEAAKRAVYAANELLGGWLKALNM